MHMKTSRIILFVALFAAIFGLSPVSFAKEPMVTAVPFHKSHGLDQIAAVVNDRAISGFDVKARMILIMKSSGMPDRPEVYERLIPQVLNMLVDEQLKVQEAENLEIEINDQEVLRGFETIASQNKMTADQFRAVLTKQGVPFKTLEDQVRAQIAWSKVVQTAIRSKVRVNDNQVDARIKRLQDNIGQTQYLVSQIFLPVENDQQEPNIRSLADRLVKQMIEARVPFARLASQFSQAAGASKGGEMGWVDVQQLPEEIANALSLMDDGELSAPIRTLTGYHILFLRAKRSISEANIPSRDDIRSQIGREILERKQRRYLMDLKSSAFIESRV